MENFIEILVFWILSSWQILIIHLKRKSSLEQQLLPQPTVQHQWLQNLTA